MARYDGLGCTRSDEAVPLKLPSLIMHLLGKLNKRHTIAVSIFASIHNVTRIAVGIFHPISASETTTPGEMAYIKQKISSRS